MTLLLSKEMVVQASNTAVVVIDKTTVHIVERQADGGLVCDISPNYTCFPVSMVREQLDDNGTGTVELSAGDWTIIPYVRDSNGKEIKTDGEYKSYEASNPSGLIHSLARLSSAIWADATKRKIRFSDHPIAVLYCDHISQLMGNSSNFSVAYEEAKRMATGTWIVLTGTTDNWDRPEAKDREGNIYVDVSLGAEVSAWHSTTEAGQPNLPIDAWIVEGF